MQASNYSNPNKVPDSLEELKAVLFQKAERLDDSVEWLESPVSPETFMFSSDFLNDRAIWPVVADDIIQLFSGADYAPVAQLFIDDEGIGSGKSTKVGLIISYLVYRLLLMKNPFKKFQLKPSTIAFMNMAPRADNAKRIVFTKIKDAIGSCRWFKDTNNLPDPLVQSVLRFFRRDLLPATPYLEVIPGNSSASFPAGADLYGGIIDEAALPGGFETAHKDGTEDLFNALNDRRNSRFGYFGLIVMISSAGTEGRYMEMVLSELEEKYGTSMGIGDWRGLKVMFRRRPYFDADPRLKDDPRFKHVIVRELPNKKELTYELNIPESFRESLKTNKYRFLRDICAIPTSAEHPWIIDWAYVLEHIKQSRDDPCPDLGEGVPDDANNVFKRLPDWFIGNEHRQYYAHVDYGSGEGVTRDACGIAIGHMERVVGEDKLPEIHIDLSIRLKSQPDKKIPPQEPFNFLANLQKLKGFRFKYVTYCGWWCETEHSALTKLGVKVEHSPIKKDDYDILWGTITGSRLDWFSDWWAFRELKSLEEKGTGRIEKSIESTDDEIECVSKVVANITRHSKHRRAYTSGGTAPSTSGKQGRAIPRTPKSGGWKPQF